MTTTMTTKTISKRMLEKEPRMSKVSKLPATTVDDLPNELFLDIAAYLPLRSLLSLRQVSRRWRGIITTGAAAGLPETTRKLLNAWLAWTALSVDFDLGDKQPNLLRNDPFGLPNICTTLPGPLDDAQRNKYVSLVGRYAIAFQTVSHEEPGLSDEFLEWLYEWPERATLPLTTLTSPVSVDDSLDRPGLLSPSAVVNALSRSASYVVNPRVNFGGYPSQPSYYYQSQVIFLIALEDEDILLPRVKLTKVDTLPSVMSNNTSAASKNGARPSKVVKCSMLNGGPGSFANDDWARFLPISTVRRACEPMIPTIDDEEQDDGDTKTPVPLYVLSGSGLGEKLAGSVCMLGDDGELNVISNSWGGYLMYLVNERRKMIQVQADRYRRKLQESKKSVLSVHSSQHTGGLMERRSALSETSKHDVDGSRSAPVLLIPPRTQPQSRARSQVQDAAMAHPTAPSVKPDTKTMPTLTSAATTISRGSDNAYTQKAHVDTFLWLLCHTVGAVCLATIALLLVPSDSLGAVLSSTRY